MTVIEERHKAWREYPELNILELCQAVKECLCGSSDAYMTTEELERAVRFFGVCVATWGVPVAQFKRYDDTILQLVVATKLLTEDEIKSRSVRR